MLTSDSAMLWPSYIAWPGGWDRLSLLVLVAAGRHEMVKNNIFLKMNSVTGLVRGNFKYCFS